MNIDDKYIFNQEGQDKWILSVKSNRNIFGVIEKEFTKTKSKSVFSIKYFWNKVFQDKLYADDIDQAKDKLIDVLNKAQNQVKHIQTFEGFLNENIQEKGIIMFSGITRDKWISIWKDKNLTDRLTNVTDDEDFAIDYSYNFKTGEYEDIYVEISNIPIDAFVAYREEDYEDDNDFHDMENMTKDEKYNILKYLANV